MCSHPLPPKDKNENKNDKDMKTTKKLTLLVSLLTSAIWTNAQENFTLTISTSTDSKVDRCIIAVLSEDKENIVRSDTLDLQGHYVQLTRHLDKAAEGMLAFLQSERSSMAAMASMAQYMVFVPGEKLEIRGDGTSWEIGGSTFYQQVGEVKSQLNALEKTYKEKLNSYSEALEAAEADKEALQTEMHKVYTDFRTQYVQTITEYAWQHPDAEGTVVWIPYAANQSEAVIAALSDRVRNESRVSPIIQRAIKENAEKKARQEATEAAKSKITEGAEAPDFTLKDIHGRNLTLSSLRGKHVVLDFWGSWCGWCIKGMPRMKEYYAKYAGKFEILGIDCNDTEEKWMKAVAEHELPWRHVYNPKQGTVPQTYAVQGFPTKFVIDPEGRIAKIFVGESEDFYNYLDEVLK